MSGTGPVTYEALAVAIARHIHRQHYREEERIDLPPIRTFDTLCAGYFQIPAGVLHKLQIMEPLDSVGCRYGFRVAPEDFSQTVRAHRSVGCSFDTLVLAAIELVGQGRECQEILDLIATLGICEPVAYRTRSVSAPRRYEDYANPEAWSSLDVPDFEITWTDRKAHYDSLRRHWVSLIA